LSRLTRIFVRDEHGRLAVFGGNDHFQHDPHWRDCIPFGAAVQWEAVLRRGAESSA
jgi:hypothetical protein